MILRILSCLQVIRKQSTGNQHRLKPLLQLLKLKTTIIIKEPRSIPNVVIMMRTKTTSRTEKILLIIIKMVNTTQIVRSNLIQMILFYLCRMSSIVEGDVHHEYVLRVSHRDISHIYESNCFKVQNFYQRYTYF